MANRPFTRCLFTSCLLTSYRSTNCRFTWVVKNWTYFATRYGARIIVIPYWACSSVLFPVQIVEGWKFRKKNLSEFLFYSVTSVFSAGTASWLTTFTWWPSAFSKAFPVSVRLEVAVKPNGHVEHYCRMRQHITTTRGSYVCTPQHERTPFHYSFFYLELNIHILYTLTHFIHTHTCCTMKTKDQQVKSVCLPEWSASSHILMWLLTIWITLFHGE